MALVGLHVVTSNGKYTLLLVANLHNTLRLVVDGKAERRKWIGWQCVLQGAGK